MIRLFIFLFLFPCLAHAAIIGTDIRFSERAEEVIFAGQQRIVVQKSFLLENPARLVIDIQRVSGGNGVGLSPQYAGLLLQNIRFGQFDADTSRLVLDLNTDKLGYQVSSEGAKLRVMLQNHAPVSSIAPRQPVSSVPAINRPPLTPSVDFPLPVPKPTYLAKEAEKPIIVIDAGHGGKDIGARGKHGTIEKHVTLTYARELRKALLRTGRYRVAMTRDDDTYLFLKERVMVARKQDGDAFISLHADSNPRGDARGLSVYTLSEQASDAEAAALAQQENKSDIIGGMDLSVEDEAVANILIDLAQRETNNKSSNLAELVISSMDKRVKLITNPHRHAGFRVLKAPDIPSILVEAGFLSNNEDERRINTPAYRDQVNQSIIKALDRFFGK